MQNFYERSLSVTGYLIKSSEKTEELISQLIKHCLERYVDVDRWHIY
jgi:hypothetical protein